MAHCRYTAAALLFVGFCSAAIFLAGTATLHAACNDDGAKGAAGSGQWRPGRAGQCRRRKRRRRQVSCRAHSAELPSATRIAIFTASGIPGHASCSYEMVSWKRVTRRTGAANRPLLGAAHRPHLLPTPAVRSQGWQWLVVIGEITALCVAAYALLSAAACARRAALPAALLLAVWTTFTMHLCASYLALHYTLDSYGLNASSFLTYRGASCCVAGGCSGVVGAVGAGSGTRLPAAPNCPLILTLAPWPLTTGTVLCSVCDLILLVLLACRAQCGTSQGEAGNRHWVGTARHAGISSPPCTSSHQNHCPMPSSLRLPAADPTSSACCANKTAAPASPAPRATEITADARIPSGTPDATGTAAFLKKTDAAAAAGANLV